MIQATCSPLLMFSWVDSDFSLPDEYVELVAGI
jgi:hypothetical protein